MKDLKAFEVETEFFNAKKCCVLAEDIGMARTTFKEEYPYAEIEGIKLRCDFVIVQKGVTDAALLER